MITSISQEERAKQLRGTGDETTTIVGERVGMMFKSQIYSRLSLVIFDFLPYGITTLRRCTLLVVDHEVMDERGFFFCHSTKFRTQIQALVPPNPNELLRAILEWFVHGLEELAT